MPLDATNYSPEPRDPILRTLQRARELLERGWCQGSLSRDGKGRESAASSLSAEKWCLAGATVRAATETQGDFTSALLRLVWESGVDPISDFNDAPGRTKAEVLAVVDAAIESRRAHLAARVECVEVAS